MSRTSKFLLCSGGREWAPCIRHDRKGTVYCVVCPLYPGGGYSYFLFMR